MIRLQDFWERCSVPVYDMDTTEYIDSDKMLTMPDAEVIDISIGRTGVRVKLNKEG